MCYKCHWYIKIFSLSNQKYREMTEEKMTNSKRLKRTFSHAIKSSSGDCELSETHKRPILWLQFLSPAQNDLVHWVTGLLGKLRPAGKCRTCWATGQTVYCMVVWLQLLGLCSKPQKVPLGISLCWCTWSGPGRVFPPILWGVGSAFKKRSLSFFLPRIWTAEVHILSPYS